jgi:hypothetical protein
VTAVGLNTDDRIVTLTIEVYNDHNVLQSTQLKVFKVDNFSEQFVIELIRDLLNQEIINASPLPYTEAQLEDMLVGLTVVEQG